VLDLVCDLPIGHDLPDELATTSDDPQLGRRPADAPRIEASPLARMERSDELGREVSVRDQPSRRRNNEPDGLRG